MAEGFFDDPKAPEAPIVDNTIKIGDKEYTQEQASRLLGLGEVADEVQSRTNRPIDKLWPQANEEHKELLELKKKMGEFENFQNRLTGVEPTPDQVNEEAKTKLKELGFVSRDDMDSEVQNRVTAHLQGQEWIKEIQQINKEAEETGKPKVDPSDLFKYMGETGFKSPTKAYKDKFENELDTWKANKMAEIKPTGYTTQQSGTPGAKEPPQGAPKSKEELQEALRSFFRASQGSENS